MNHLKNLDLAKSADRLLNHGPTTLVTFEHAGVRNVMAASWAMPLDFDPPKVLLVWMAALSAAPCWRDQAVSCSTCPRASRLN
jgi:flavin reductase (DIM6/NTAB) family NADH-FMN oxidoreductase RutF